MTEALLKVFSVGDRVLVVAGVHAAKEGQIATMGVPARDHPSGDALVVFGPGDRAWVDSTLLLRQVD